MRLVIIGNSGSGKSSYARQLARLHDLAYLDSIVWKPHQIAVARAASDVHADLERFVTQHDRWVIEGCAASSPRRGSIAAPSWCS